MSSNKSRQMILNLVASIVVFFVQFVINFWLSPFVVSKLGEEAYGFITLANNFTQYVTLVTIAVNSMASRFISLEYNKGNYVKANEYFTSVFWINVILSLIIFLVSLALIFKLETLVNIKPDLVWDVKLTFALSFINLITSSLSTCFTATAFITNRMDYHAFIQIGTNLIKMFVIIGTFLLLYPKIYFVSLATLSGTVFSFVAYILLRRKLIPGFKLNRTYFSIQSVAILAKSGLWILVSNISSLLLNGMDLLLANIFINQIAMSRLSISKQLPIAIGGLLGFLSNIFAASFTVIVAENNRDKLVWEICFTCKILGVFLTVPFAGIIVYGQNFFSLWLPKSVYNIPAITQIYILMILTLANVIVNAYMYSIHSLFIAIDKVKTYSVMVFISSIISIILTVILTKFTQLGVYAIAGTSTIVLGIVNLILVPRYAEHVLGVQPFLILRKIFKNYVALLVTSILFFMVKPFLNLSGWSSFIVSVTTIGLAGYFIDFIILLDKNEKQRVLHIVKSKFHK